MIMLRRTEARAEDEPLAELAGRMTADRSLLGLVGPLSRVVALIEEAALGRATEPAEPAERDRSGSRPTREDLRRHFLSDREAVILRELDVQGGRVRRAKDVAFAVARKGISRTEFYVLWSNLEFRGLIKLDAKHYYVAADWVYALAAGGEEVGDV